MKDLKNMTNDEIRALANIIIMREAEEQSDPFFVHVGADILNNLFAYGKKAGETLEDISDTLMTLLTDEESVVKDLNKVIDFHDVIKRATEKTRFACYVVARVALENFIKRGEGA